MTRNRTAINKTKALLEANPERYDHADWFRAEQRDSYWRAPAADGSLVQFAAQTPQSALQVQLDAAVHVHALGLHLRVQGRVDLQTRWPQLRAGRGQQQLALQGQGVPWRAQAHQEGGGPMRDVVTDLHLHAPPHWCDIHADRLRQAARGGHGGAHADACVRPIDVWPQLPLHTRGQHCFGGLSG